MSIAHPEIEPASPTGDDVPAHRVRHLLSAARLVLDVIASTGCRDMRPGELARRMHLRGHNVAGTDDIVVILLQRGLLTSDETTLRMTDIGWQVASRRTPLNRARAPVAPRKAT